ncbi:hypothetical protein ASG42_21930 [Rhizobium sp. Leaf391]|nr:hypothetical protein ASG42_21930 [Rhizobium sp. Leaf391]
MTYPSNIWALTSERDLARVRLWQLSYLIFMAQPRVQSNCHVSNEGRGMDLSKDMVNIVGFRDIADFGRQFALAELQVC